MSFYCVFSLAELQKIYFYDTYFQVKINSMEREAESKNKLKQNDWKKKLADSEKKCSKITEQFTNEQKKASKTTNKISVLEQETKKWKEAFEKAQTENKQLAASVSNFLKKHDSVPGDLVGLTGGTVDCTWYERCCRFNNISHDMYNNVVGFNS